tara:strand:+ start:51 stop:623 length:573 start_codon:yes stop_codon:yes gene_type:complete
MKKKVLIIGSSGTIKKLSILLFRKKAKLHFLSFRKAWVSKKISKYDIIILTGFHFKVCYLKKHEIKIYINEYYNFLFNVKKKCKKLILITTFLNIRYSFCRVVYFYYTLLCDYNLLKIKNIEIYNFRKIILIDLLKMKFFKKIFLLFNFECIENIVNNFLSYKVKKINTIKFYFINLPRTRFVDRILRIL